MHKHRLGDFAPDFMHTASLAVWVVYVLLTLSLAGALRSVRDMMEEVESGSYAHFLAHPL